MEAPKLPDPEDTAAKVFKVLGKLSEMANSPDAPREVARGL